MPAKARLIAAATSSAIAAASTSVEAFGAVTGIWVVGGGMFASGTCVVIGEIVGTACVIGEIVGTACVIGGGGTVDRAEAVIGTAWVIGGALRLFRCSDLGCGAGSGSWGARTSALAAGCTVG